MVGEAHFHVALALLNVEGHHEALQQRRWRDAVHERELVALRENLLQGDRLRIPGEHADMMMAHLDWSRAIHFDVRQPLDPTGPGF